MKRRLLAGLCSLLLLNMLTGCTYVPLGASSDGESTPSTAPSAVASSGNNSTATTSTTAATTASRAVNPLTGLYDLAPGDSTRAVGIMIGNDSASRPQYGLDQADWFIEAETEGGITRILAVFANTSRVPSQLGPVRSARTPFVLLAQSLDLIYVHAGGSTAALAKLRELDLADINALAYDGTTFWRDAALRQSKGLEYSMMTSGSKLTTLVGKQNFRTASKNGVPFTFSTDNAAGETAGQLQCKVSAGQTVNFKYYPEENLYYKRNGTLSQPSTHASAAGVQLSVANVIVLFDSRYNENSTTIGFRLESGSGMLFTGGKVRPIQWRRSASGLRFTESDGSPARVSTGKSYILLVSDSYRSGTTYTA